MQGEFYGEISEEEAWNMIFDYEDFKEQLDTEVVDKKTVELGWQIAGLSLCTGYYLRKDGKVEVEE